MFHRWRDREEWGALLFALLVLLAIFAFSILTGQARAQQVASPVKEVALSSEDKLVILEAKVALLEKTNGALRLQIQFFEQLREVEKAQKGLEKAATDISASHPGFHLDPDRMKLFELPSSAKKGKHETPATNGKSAGIPGQ